MYENITHSYSSKIRTAIGVSIVIILSGCASDRANLSALSTTPIFGPVPAAPIATSATTLPTQPSGGTTPTTVNQVGNANTKSAYAAIIQTVPYKGGSGNAITSFYPYAPDINASATVTYGSNNLPSALTISSSNFSGGVSQNLSITNFPSSTQPFSIYLDNNIVIGQDTSGNNVMQNDAVTILNDSYSGNSATAFNYQSFGIWEYHPTDTSNGFESAFSYGIPTATMPYTGTAVYSGIASGNFIDSSGNVFNTSATMSSTANFGAGTIAFSTSNTTTVNSAGTPFSSPNLDLNGTLSISANNFTGTVTNSGNTMSGNATGLFYGPGITASTTKSSLGSPAEIGGTYALTGTGGGMIGAFGGKVQ